MGTYARDGVLERNGENMFPLDFGQGMTQYLLYVCDKIM